MGNYIVDEQRTINLLVLCYAINEFDKFDKELLELLSNKNSENTINKIIDISEGKTCILSKEEKKFYKDNEFIINIIKKYGNLPMFLWDNYYKDIINKHDELIQFVNYVKENKKYIDKIITVLEKLNELGFSKIIFDETLDFTNETYTIAKYLQDNLEIVYLDNLEAIPNYSSQIVNYKTTGSNYKINLAITDGKINSDSMLNTITLNSLIFDPKRLPENLGQEDTFDKILDQTLSIIKENRIIKDAVDLSISVDDMEETYNRILKKIENLTNVDKKAELISHLNHLKQIIINMKYISEENNKEVIANNSNITNEILQREHYTYRKRK